MDSEHEKQSVSRQVFTKIEQLLKSGAVQPGELLPSERELAAQFGVGRPAVREALKALEMMGVIEIIHGKGARVLTPDLDAIMKPLIASIVLTQSNVLNLIEVREVVEPQCAAIAATRATAEQLQKLHESLRQMERAAEIPGEFAAADYHFHNLVAQATNNPLLIRIYETITALLWDLQQKTAAIPDHQKTLRYHESIYQCIYRRDAPEALSVMKQHIHDTRTRFMNYQTGQAQPQ